MVECNRDGVFSLGEECDEVHVEFETIIVLDWQSEVGERVDIVFGLSPMEDQWLVLMSLCRAAYLKQYRSCEPKIWSRYNVLTSRSSSPNASLHSPASP